VRTLGIFCASILCLAWGFSVPAQETLSSVQRELDRVEREIEREKELHKQERKRAEEFEKQKSQRLQALVDQGKVTQARIDSLKRQVDKARHQKTTQKSQAQFYAGKENEFRKAFAASLRGLANELRTDFPYNREKRVADIEELAKSVEANVTPSEEALNRFSGLLSSSLDFSSDVEVYAGVYTAKTGGNHEGTYVRLGAAFLGFISQGGEVGALLAKRGSEFQWLDSELPPETRQALAASVRVAQGKESPRLVGLPILLSQTTAPAPDSTKPVGGQP
jgi:cell division FtsZ-interacting protein ZapD